MDSQQPRDEDGYLAIPVRKLFSKQKFREILVNEFVFRQANPKYLLGGWWDSLCEGWTGIKDVLEGLLTIFVACLRFVFCFLLYLWYVVRLLTFPISVPLLVRFYRRKKYRRSLDERAGRIRAAWFGQNGKPIVRGAKDAPPR